MLNEPLNLRQRKKGLPRIRGVTKTLRLDLPLQQLVEQLAKQKISLNRVVHLALYKLFAEEVAEFGVLAKEIEERIWKGKDGETR